MLVSTSTKNSESNPKSKSSTNKAPPMARPVKRGPSPARGRGGVLPTQTRATIDRVSREVPKSLAELERLPPYLILLVLGGLCAIGLGAIFLVIDILTFRHIMINIAQAIISFIFGFLLLWTYTQVRNAPQTAYILGIIFSIVLFFGNLGGVIGGILGIIGSLLLLLKTEGIIR